MPKYTRKNRLEKNQNPKLTDENLSIDDGVSSCSNISDLTSVYDEDETSNNLSIVTTENIDEKIEILTENLRNRDGRTRENALRQFELLFRQNILENCGDSLIEVLLNCLRRAGENEGKLAANVASLVALQFSGDEENLYERFRNVLLPVIRDSSRSASQRAKYVDALGLICFLSCDDPSDSISLMNELETIFSLFYSHDDEEKEKFENDFYELASSALSSWILIFTTISVNESHRIVREKAPKKFVELLDTPNGEFRNLAAEAVAILHEVAFQIQSVFAEPTEDLLIKLHEKSKESSKSKSKKEKRLQHATFRQVLNWFEDGSTVDLEIKFHNETLQISSWTNRFYYSIFSRILGNGTVTHLKENSFLRSIFDLNDPEINQNNVERDRPTKSDFKYRTEQLKKNRDRKSLRYELSDF